MVQGVQNAIFIEGPSNVSIFSFQSRLELTIFLASGILKSSIRKSGNLSSCSWSHSSPRLSYSILFCCSQDLGFTGSNPWSMYLRCHVGSCSEPVVWPHSGEEPKCLVALCRDFQAIFQVSPMTLSHILHFLVSFNTNLVGGSGVNCIPFLYVIVCRHLDNNLNYCLQMFGLGRQNVYWYQMPCSHFSFYFLINEIEDYGLCYA